MALNTANRTKPATDGKVVVGVSDLAVVKDPNATIITYALGSCIGVTVYDPIAHVGGMLHCLLPSGRNSPDKVKANPAMFGDSGIPLLIESAKKLGASESRLVVCAAGAGEVMNIQGECKFKIGARNRTVLRKMLWKMNILLKSEDTGGTISRTLSLNLDTGLVRVRSQGKESLLWPK